MDKYRAPDWTGGIPSRLEGYGEAAPEGLLDTALAAAGKAGRRRCAPVWGYYTAGALALAAAALALVVTLWSPGDENPSVTATQVLAEASPVSEESLPAEALSAEETSLAQSFSVGSAKTVRAPGGTAENLPVTGDADRTIPPADNPQAPTAETAAPASQEGDSPADSSAKADSGTWQTVTPAGGQSHPIPQVERSRKNAAVKFKAGVSRTGYLAQAVTASETGVGFPSTAGLRFPGTKAGGALSDAAVIPMMLSRNKVSTTDVEHDRSARIAINLQAAAGDHWGLETGLVYSSLSSRYTTTAASSENLTTRDIGYLGIPLNVLYYGPRWRRLSLYLSAGPMYEFTVRTVEKTVTGISGSEISSSRDASLYKDDKWSLNLGSGAQYNITKAASLFVQPGLAWYPDDRSSLETYYTEHPLSWSLTLGLRVGL